MRPATDGILACPLGYQRFVLQNDRERGVILSGATCPLVEKVAARRPCGHPSAPSLLRKTAPFLCPPAAVTVLPLRRCSDAVCSHASHACAAGRHLLRLSMCARHYVPNAHASLRICLPAHTARTLYVVTPPDAPQPVDISSVSACAPGTACRTPTPRYGTYLPAALLERCMQSRLARVCGLPARR